jgi:hypothetical protein
MNKNRKNYKTQMLPFRELQSQESAVKGRQVMRIGSRVGTGNFDGDKGIVKSL